MRTMPTVIAVAVLAAHILSTPSVAVAQTRPVESLTRLSPESLEQGAKTANDLEEFADAIVREVLVAAARKVKEQKLDASSVTVTLEFRVTALPLVVPSPADLNVCWELHGGGRNYYTCAAPIPAPITDRDKCAYAWRALFDAMRRKDAEAIARYKRQVEQACASAKLP